MNKEMNLVEGSINKVFYKFLFNSIIGMLAVSFTILVDTMFIGRGLGSKGLAALNICIPIFNVLTGVGLLLGMGGATALSISIGQKDVKRSHLIFTQTMFMAVIIGIVLTILSLQFRYDIAYFLGADASTIDDVIGYLTGVFIFSASYILAHTTASFVRNDNNPKLVMISTLITGLVNILLDYIFIFPLGLGLFGAALATSIASVVNLAILSTHYLRSTCHLKFVRIRFEFNRMIRILRNGLPNFIIEISFGFVIFIFNLALLELIGEIGVSAYSIIANVALIVGAIFSGIAQAIQPIVSVNYGANHFKRVQTVRNKGLIWALSLGILFYIGGLFYPQFIVGFFTSEKGDIVNITVNAIKIYFIAFPFMGINIVLSSYFQAKEYILESNIISLGRGLIFMMIGILTLPHLFNVDGLWLSALFAEITTMIALVIFLASKNLFKKI